MNQEQIEKEQFLWKRRQSRRMALLGGFYGIVALIVVVFALVKKVESDEKIEQLELQVGQREQESLAAMARAEKAEAVAKKLQMIAEEQRKAAVQLNAQLQSELEKCRKGRR